VRVARAPGWLTQGGRGTDTTCTRSGQARIRVQLSAAHTREQIDRAIAAFVDVGRKRGVIP
jgi:hypothetical protein